MKNIYKTATRLASSSIPVLILGETGTGKEIVARMIQQASERRDGPMICINCGGIPSQLVESTLFGHERGAFTGAHRQAQGVFESANNGTVFLDEIGELPLPAQAALLRVLETSRFSRVGSNKEVETDVRVLAATNQGLVDMCQAGAFRKDLLYRLNTMTIEIPLLRDRPEDIGPLTMNFIEKANQANNCSITHIDKAAMKLLMAYSWPGNVRELRNTIERAVVISEHNIITEADLTERIRKSDSVTPPSPAPGKKRPTAGNLVPDYEINLKSELRQYEAELILNALNVVDWDRGEAAKKLGLPIRTLSHKIQSLGIKR
jgi:DNA-binding NtrC family response regulator